jgi:hypothetical protein
MRRLLGGAAGADPASLEPYQAGIYVTPDNKLRLNEILEKLRLWQRVGKCLVKRDVCLHQYCEYASKIDSSASQHLFRLLSSRSSS